MLREGRLADFYPGIQHAGGVQRVFDPHKQVIQAFAEHLPDHLGANSSIAVLPANGPVKPIQNRVMHFIIRFHHSLHVTLVIHVQQRHDVGVAVPDVPENRQRNLRGSENLIQISNQLAHAFRCDDHVINVVDGLFLGVVPIERRVQGFSGFPEIPLAFGVGRDDGVSSKTIPPTRRVQSGNPAGVFLLIEFNEQGCLGVGGNVVS